MTGEGLDQAVLDAVFSLRRELHAMPERSGAERRTKARLLAFLRERTSLRLDDRGAWFCALHAESGATETVAFRADMDALPRGDGAAHLCGHDGHSAALCGLALLLEGKRLGRNVLLVFQHAEETGAGGEACAKALSEYGPSRVFAFHNIPGYEQGAILLRRGTFACASVGMTLSFAGAPAHAAYPEDGRNPGLAAARLISALPALMDPARFGGLTMATLIGADIGSRSFGTAASSAAVRLTLRAQRDADLTALTASLQTAALSEASRDGVDVTFSFCDRFPATENDGGTLSRLEEICRAAALPCRSLPEPFRWSEDFGHYGAFAKSVMIGIGAGEDWPPLHTARYEFNDNLLPVAMRLFYALAEEG